MLKKAALMPILLIMAVAMTLVMASAYGEDKPQQPVDIKKADELSLEDLLNTKISVSSTKGETILKSSSAVTIIDRKMIEQFGFRDLEEALQTVAGVTVMRSYMLQGMITSRGMLQDLYANKNLLLIDSVPVWNAVTGENRPERVHINDIERIEILKGPASVLYGSQAYTSAINIVTRAAKPGTQGLEGYTTAGRGRANGIGANYRIATTKGLQFAIGVNRNHGQRIFYDFFDENNTRGKVRDYTDINNATMKLGYGGHSLLMNVFDQEDGSFGSAPGFKTGANTAHRLQGALANYQFDRTFKNKLSFRTRSFYDFAHREFQRDAINNVYSPILAYRTGAAARMNYEFTGSLNLEVGGDWEYRHANEASSRNRTTGALVDGFVDKAVNEGSTFVQLDWSPGAWRFIGGTRFSRNSTFGSNVSSRGTVGYSINDNNAVKFVAGQSYRSPSIFEIFTATPNISGNPALKPETSDSFDLVYQYNKGGFYVQADGYFAQYKEKIYRKKGTPPAGAPQPKAPAFYENGSPVHAFGLEVEAKYVSPKWGTYFVNVDSLDGSHGDLVVEQPGSYQNYNFRYVPTYNVSFGLAKQFRHVGMSALVDNSGATNGPFGKVNGWTDLQLNIYFEHPLKDLTIRHTFSGRNVLASNVAFPEFSRRKANVNELPMGADSGFFYTLSFRFFEK